MPLALQRLSEIRGGKTGRAWVLRCTWASWRHHWIT